jgi:D-alanyl-D-alanine carboxypeptidase
MTSVKKANRFTVFLFLLCASLLVLAARPAEARYASIVVDADTGEVLHSVNPNQQNYPASLTKMMTLYLTFDALKTKKVRLSDRVVFSDEAEGQAPSKLGLRSGQSITVEQAILALVTKSANDVAVALAEHISGDEEDFSRLMTAKARWLGMSRTVFRNASGLPDPEQVSTARDMATLGRALVHNFPEYYHYFKVRHFTFNGQTISTHNRLMLTYKGADGMKTGYIRASGFNLVSSAQRGGKRLIGVVFGGNTASQRDRHMAQLLDKGFAAHGKGSVRQAKVKIEDLENQTDEATADQDDDVQMAAAPAKNVKSANGKTKTASASASAAATPVKSVTMPASQGGKSRVARNATSASASEEGDREPSWGIQVGAYGRYGTAYQAANEAQKQIAQLFPLARVTVLSHRANGQMIYRARLVGATESQARAACKKMANSPKSAPCQIVAPEGTVSSGSPGSSRNAG